MNSSQFRDKKIMGLLGSQNNDFFDLMNPQAELSGGGMKEDVLPSYNFKPFRPVGVSQSMNLEGSNAGGTRVWNSEDSKTGASYSRDPNGSAKVTPEEDQNAYDAVMVSEVDRTMKKHTDNLLHALESVNTRLSQLESRTCQLESSVDDLRVSTGNNYGSTNGKLRQLENILKEVQTGVQVLKDKQEIVEAQLQLTKLHQSENQNTVHTDSVQQTTSAPQQSHSPLPPPAALPQPPQPLPLLPPLNVPPPSLQQNLPPGQLPSQLPQTQIPPVPQQESDFPPPGQTLEEKHQQYQIPPTQQPQYPPPVPHQHYQPTPQAPQYSQPVQPPQQLPPVGPVNPSQFQPSLSHHTEETHYMPSQNYPPSIHQLPSMTQRLGGAPPTQQFYGAPTHMYETQSNRPSSGFSQGYDPTSGPNFSDSYPYSGSPSSYSSSTMKPSRLSSSPSAPGGGSNYPHLPTAQILPHALPTATSIGSNGSSSGGTGNRVPIDDVVDKVTTMGFSRDQVRAAVRKLTENGQSVDLNVVLDKLMNDEEIQPQNGWFSR